MARPKGSTNKSTRSSSTGATSKKQAPLSFQNKITKPTPTSALGKAAKKDAADAAAKAAKLEESLSEVADVSVSGSAEGSIIEPVEAEEVEAKEREQELAIRQPQKVVVDESEEKAKKTSDAQVRRYWKGVDEMRKAPRVHQQSLSVNDKILRHFDMSSQFGPSIGIPRTTRWKRANKLRLNPPIEVLAVLLKEEAADKKKGVQISHVDEMINARVGVAD
ncbi:hypothetical protein MMC10_003755 [Thelotrema lepadinum]|nr:hypothetical protein [Thelotrema lepadinum]